MTKDKSKKNAGSKKNNKRETSVELDGDMLVIRMPVDVDNPPLSTGGKMHLAASTHGFHIVEDITYKGRPLKLAVNAGFSIPKGERDD